MKKYAYIVSIVFITILYGCSTDCADYQAVMCVSDIRSNVDTITVGDTIFFESSIDDFITYGFKKYYDISDVNFTCAFIVKPISEAFGEADFENIQSTVTSFMVYSSTGQKQSLIEYFQTKNQAIAGTYEHKNNKMRADYYFVAQDTGLFAIKLSTDIVKTHKTGHCNKNFDIDYQLNQSINFDLNKKYIKEDSLLHDYLVVRVKL